MNNQLANVAEAFSRKALVYDEFGLNHVNLAYMRRKVRQHILGFLQSRDRILELNAGTGADAVFFARRGFNIHATDISPGMLAQIQAKIDHYNLQERLTLQQCSFSFLEEVVVGPFQYVFSNMGGVNCLEDLTRITRRLGNLLQPGGYVTWVVMPPICPWELAQALRGRLQIATRRLSSKGVLANVEGVHFMTYYYTPQQVRRAFGMNFRPVKLQGLSVFTPTADNPEFPRRHPRLYSLLRFIDERLSNVPPFNHWGDFFILTLQYLPLNT